MKKSFIIVLFFISLLTFGQVTDDFSDGDFSTNPVWTADHASNWTIPGADLRLRSNSSAASASFYITTPSTKALNAEWSFFVHLQFNTSSANYADVYLMSEQADLRSSTNNGYFVRIGGTPDEISLYKVTAGVTSILINGTDGITNTSSNSLRIKVIRTAANQWSLLRDVTGGTNFVSEGTVTDNSFTSCSFFGIKIQQSTSSFFNRHFFDDIYAGDIIVDTTPPAVQSIQVVNQHTLNVVFSEKPETASAQSVLNYTVSNSIGHPSSAVLLADGNAVQLTFQTDFSNGIAHLISIQSVKDAAGNSLSATEKTFQYFMVVAAQAKDILITEIMADPSPVVQLPEAEYIEIYNRSAYAFDLAGWKLSDAAGTATLPSSLLLPGSFLVLTATANSSKFAPDIKLLAVSNFPSLNNDGESLVLKASGITVDSVNYSSAMYRDDEKEDGGWSLELIDTANTCGEEENWIAAEDEQGGTPGKRNSVSANKPDLTGPALQVVTPVNSMQLIIGFNEKLEKNIDLSSFQFTPDLKIGSAHFTDLSLRHVQITLAEEMKTRQLYAIHIANLRDCNGNIIQEEYSRAEIALPEIADSLDLVINEVLSNPRTGGVDFVEVYNRSQKYINLKNAKLTSYEAGNIVNPKVVTTADFIIRPADYVVLTTDRKVLKDHYPQSISEKFLRSDLPGLPDDAGSVAFVSNEGKMLDFFAYTEKYHSPLIKEEEGVSLERISFTQPTNDAANWRSATAVAGFATPGFINSNTRPDQQTNAEVQVSPEIFSMQVPGNDFAQIQYRFEESGYVANVKIYDQQGRAIKEIVNNGTIGYDGAFRWDGDRDDGTKAKSGYYLVWFEAFNTNGLLKTFRKRVIIASR